MLRRQKKQKQIWNGNKLTRPSNEIFVLRYLMESLKRESLKSFLKINLTAKRALYEIDSKAFLA